MPPLRAAETLELEEELEEAGPPQPWQSVLGLAKQGWSAALDSMFEEIEEGPFAGTEVDFAFLTVTMDLGIDFETICEEVNKRLNCSGVLLASVGAGICGDGIEVEQDSALSLLIGELPPDTEIVPFVMTGAVPGPDSETWASIIDEAEEDEAPPAFLLVADPFSRITEIMQGLDKAFPRSIKAGGLSVPPGQTQASIALYADSNGGVLEAGSCLGIALGGPYIEVHAICAQGALGVGPAHLVTKGEGNVVTELAGKSAVQALIDVSQSTEDARVRALLSKALLVGIPGRDSDELTARDFLIRQVLGAGQGGSIVVGDNVSQAHPVMPASSPLIL